MAFLPHTDNNGNIFYVRNRASASNVLKNGRVKTRTLPPMFEGVREKGAYASAPAATYATFIMCSDNVRLLTCRIRYIPQGLQLYLLL